MTTNLLTPDEKVPVTIEDEVRRSYLDYAMSVIIGRALPDVRDGLKPVHRRCLYGMWEQGNLHNKPYRKSARIVGDVLGKYHPHGESAVYDSVVRMAQDFSLRYPLVDGQGNFGSVDGDNAAAMRYTEVRLTKLAAELLGDDIDKETVDWTPNYDGSLVEPMVLPAKFPNLLVNGSTGIAVGMATNIPPHNLSEVIDATIELIKHPDATLGQLMRKLPGPDFPTGAFIHGSEGIRDAYKTGRGTVQVRARAMIEKAARGDKESIVVTEIPYQVNKAKLIERIAELVNDKKIEGVADLRDESNREGMRIVVELKRGENAQVVLNKLYAMTPMQSSFGIIFLAIVENQPRVLPLHDLLRHFVDHRKAVVIRRTQFDLKKAEERAHLLRGLALALANLDLVIKIIRSSKDPQEAKARLTAEVSMTRAGLEKFIGSSLGDEGGKGTQVLRLDEIQAQAILDMRLHRLTGLERDKIVAEFKEILALIARLKEILGSEKLVLEIIVEELQHDPEAVRRRAAHGDRGRGLRHRHRGPHRRRGHGHHRVPRRLHQALSPVALPRPAPRRQGADRRDDEGRGSRRAPVRGLDPRLRPGLHVDRPHALDQGLRHSAARPGDARQGDRQPPEPRVRTSAWSPWPRRRTFRRTGTSSSRRRTASSRRRRSRHTRTSARAESSRSTSRRATSSSRCASRAARTRSSSAPARAWASGSRRRTCAAWAATRPASSASSLKKKDDVVVEMDVVDESGHLLSVTENGYGKRSGVTEYRLQGRGGSGVINVKVTEKNGPVVGIKSVTDADQLLLISERGQLIRIKVKDIRETGRAAQGVRVIDLDEGDRLVAMAKLAESDDAEDEAQAALPVGPAAEKPAEPGKARKGQEGRDGLPGRRRRGRGLASSPFRGRARRQTAVAS